MVDQFELLEGEKTGTLAQSFDIESKIGQGSYGSVFRATHKRTLTVVAVKKIMIDGDLEQLMHEIEMLSSCDSPNIIHLFGFFVETQFLFMVMEYCPAGSVADIIRATGHTLTEPQIAVIVKDTLLGLNYLHGHGKLHRDIKAGNILIDNDGHAKLADFGVAGQLTDSATKRKTVIGTPFWMSEVVQEIGYTTKADIWSLGITCIEMAEGRPPNHKLNPMRFIFMIPTRPPPKLANESKWTSSFAQFLARCLVKNPDLRPPAPDLLLDPFLEYASDHADLQRLAQVTMTVRQDQEPVYDQQSSDDESDNEEEFMTVRPPGKVQATLRPRNARMKLVMDDSPVKSTTGSVESVTNSLSTMIVRDKLSANANEGPVFPISAKGTIKPSIQKPVPAILSLDTSRSPVAAMSLSLDRHTPPTSPRTNEYAHHLNKSLPDLAINKQEPSTGLVRGLAVSAASKYPRRPSRENLPLPQVQNRPLPPFPDTSTQVGHVPYRVRHGSNPNNVYNPLDGDVPVHSPSILSSTSKPGSSNVIEDPRTGQTVVFERRADSLRNLANHQHTSPPEPARRVLSSPSSVPPVPTYTDLQRKLVPGQAGSYQGDPRHQAYPPTQFRPSDLQQYTRPPPSFRIQMQQQPRPTSYNQEGYESARMSSYPQQQQAYQQQPYQPQLQQSYQQQQYPQSYQQQQYPQSYQQQQYPHSYQQQQYPQSYQQQQYPQSYQQQQPSQQYPPPPRPYDPYTNRPPYPPYQGGYDSSNG